MDDHIVCYSGGHSSALVAVEVAREHRMSNVVLLNHDINANIEDADVKRFKKEVSDYLGIPITYANHPRWDAVDQFDVCMEAKAFKVGNGSELCTNRLKTAPFMDWLYANYPEKNCVIHYGFDADEQVRIQRRSSIMGQLGYKTFYPLALVDNERRTILSIDEIGIDKPNTYGSFKHANCKGCLKAGKQHWYIIYLTRRDLWEKGKVAEDYIGHSIHSDWYLEDVESDFEKMKCLGITTTEHEDGRTFFARVRRMFKDIAADADMKPCECVF